ncbi:MAG: type II toxin-antitoxin system RelE/ParE family toxin [Nitrospinae bacterium]|nr:type II toxin-antitoxin system RelE/ParE family toxin [Nitrospinota bacterium]
MVRGFNVLYHQDIKDDLARINEKLKARIKTAIETRLMTEPERYGAPLRKTLKGCWKLRVGDYRIVFRIRPGVVTVLAILHRKQVYETVGRRV